MYILSLLSLFYLPFLSKWSLLKYQRISSASPPCLSIDPIPLRIEVGNVAVVLILGTNDWAFRGLL